jgi:hypothetical protein
MRFSLAGRFRTGDGSAFHFSSSIGAHDTMPSAPGIFALTTFALFYPALAEAEQVKKPIRLAQEFLLPAPGPPRATCNSIVNAGHDVGETVPIDVSGTTGTIDFQYDTHYKPDRMFVFIDRRLVFDTGCLGTNGYRSQLIPLPEGAMNLTVRIEPNCMGDTDTSWEFKLVCPIP